METLGEDFWKTAPRILELMLHEIVENDLKITGMYNDMVTGGVETDKRFVKVNVIRPGLPLPIDSAEFDHSGIMDCIQLGYDTAERYWESQRS
jgi:hypothetical protein